MIIIEKMKVDIYTPMPIAMSNNYKDNLIDNLIYIRDKIRTRYNQEPVLSCSTATDYYLERLFKSEKIYKRDFNNTTFWAMPLYVTSPESGYIYFSIKENNNDK